jgi:hypothetical protein
MTWGLAQRRRMNLRRGLLRLWVVFSVAWIIAVGSHGLHTLGSTDAARVLPST